LVFTQSLGSQTFWNFEKTCLSNWSIFCWFFDGIEIPITSGSLITGFS
jgi:hypothetical protein